MLLADDLNQLLDVLPKFKVAPCKITLAANNLSKSSLILDVDQKHVFLTVQNIYLTEQ